MNAERISNAPTALVRSTRVAVAHVVIGVIGVIGGYGVLDGAGPLARRGSL